MTLGEIVLAQHTIQRLGFYAAGAFDARAFRRLRVAMNKAPSDSSVLCWLLDLLPVLGAAPSYAGLAVGLGAW